MGSGMKVGGGNSAPVSQPNVNGTQEAGNKSAPVAKEASPQPGTKAPAGNADASKTSDLNLLGQSMRSRLEGNLKSNPVIDMVKNTASRKNFGEMDEAALKGMLQGMSDSDFKKMIMQSGKWGAEAQKHLSKLMNGSPELFQREMKAIQQIKQEQDALMEVQSKINSAYDANLKKSRDLLR
jgi:hypothetical protein